MIHAAAGDATRARGRHYLLSPQALVDNKADRVSIYYGGADTVVGLAHGHLSEILDFTAS